LSLVVTRLAVAGYANHKNRRHRLQRDGLGWSAATTWVASATRSRGKCFLSDRKQPTGGQFLNSANLPRLSLEQFAVPRSGVRTDAGRLATTISLPLANLGKSICRCAHDWKTGRSVGHWIPPASFPLCDILRCGHLDEDSLRFV